MLLAECKDCFASKRPSFGTSSSSSLLWPTAARKGQPTEHAACVSIRRGTPLFAFVHVLPVVERERLCWLAAGSLYIYFCSKVDLRQQMQGSLPLRFFTNEGSQQPPGGRLWKWQRYARSKDSDVLLCKVDHYRLPALLAQAPDGVYVCTSWHCLQRQAHCCLNDSAEQGLVQGSVEQLCLVCKGSGEGRVAQVTTVPKGLQGEHPASAEAATASQVLAGQACMPLLSSL